MLHRQLRLLLLGLTSRQQPTRLQHVLDLPPVELHLRKLIQVFRSDSTVTQEALPDHPTTRNRQIRIADGDVNSGVKGRIDGSDSVGCEEHGAFVILEDTEEDGDHLVAIKVVSASRFEEDVCLVKEEDGFPFGDHVHDCVQCIFDTAGVQA